MFFCMTLFNRCFYFLFFLTLLNTQLKAQEETFISGKVTELVTMKGIPFVTILIKGTTIGTSTDFEGNYSIKTSGLIDSIYVSKIGCYSMAKFVKKGESQTIDFQLSSEILNLDIVEIRPGNNPAHRIIKNTINYKEKYNRINLNSIQFLSYTKQEVAIDNITNRMRNRKIFRPVVNMWDSLDHAIANDKSSNLPVAMSEVVSEVYYRKEGKLKHENVNAIQVKFVGMKDGNGVSQFTSMNFEDYNFCNNTVSIQGKDFLSPIADNAMLFYNYYLIDSMLIDSTICYRVDVSPKNNKDLAFTGSLWITDTSFSIKQLDLEITKDVNFNLVDRVRIQQQLLPTGIGAWVPSQTLLMIDYANITKHFLSVVVHIYNRNRYFVVNKPKELLFYNTPLEFAEDAITKDSSFWIKSRPNQLTASETISYNMIDTMRNLPVVKNTVDILYFLFSGYKDVGVLDIGHYSQLYAYNQYEGMRLRIGFRTNAMFSKKWILRAYCAYGFKDEKIKYNFQIENIITHYPWSKVGVQYRDDIDQIGLNYDIGRNINLTQSQNYLFNTFSQIGNISKLVRKKEVRIWYEKYFNAGFNTKIIFQNIYTTPLFPVAFGDQFNIFQQRNYTISELLLETRLSVKERYIQNGIERISLGNNKSPIITFNYTLGIKHLFAGDFNYQKASISLSNRFKLGIFGNSKLLLKVGKVFSQIPYTLLEIPRGNETFFYSDNGFNQMNFFEFVCDQYVEVHLKHHFMGLLFNRIPLVKKLNFREVVGCDLIYGTLSKKNYNFNSNNIFTVMRNVPYLEVNFGVENIFDIVKIEFVYRLSYNDNLYRTNYANENDNSKINNFGIKLGLQFAF